MVRPARPSFLRLDAAAGWRVSPVSAGVAEDPSDGTLQLGFVGGRISPLGEAAGSFGGLTLPTGVAVGPGGVILVADPSARTILHYPNPAIFVAAGEDAPGFAPLWPATDSAAAPPPPDPCAVAGSPPPAGPYSLVAPYGLAFSRDGDLVLADRGDTATAARIIVYAWPAMAVRRIVELPGGEPTDIAFDSHGWLHVADARAMRVRRFDRLYREEQGWPGGAPDLNMPRHLAFDREDRLLVIDADPETGRSRLSELTAQGRVVPVTPEGGQGAIAEAEVWKRRFPPPVTLDGDTLYAPGNGCLERGAALRNVMLDRRGRLLGGGPVLMYRPPPGRRLRRGTWITAALDGEAFEFAWHRAVFEMDLTGATALEVQSFTWSHEIEPGRIAAMPETNWSRRIVLKPGQSPEVLIQSPPGRYLWLRIGLIGDGLATPSLRSVTLLAPRRSSLAYLPAPYHEDPVSRDFLDRFLSYFDTVFDEIEARIELFAGQIDPRGAPEGAFLAWLASWFDISFLAQWNTATRRAFVASAMRLHRARGTLPGLREVLRLHLGPSAPAPVLIEGFRIRDFAERRQTAEPDLADGTLRIAGYPLSEQFTDEALAHRFAVVVPQALVVTPEEEQALVRLVDIFRPAHTEWSLILAGPGIRVGCQSTIGVDTLLGSYPSGPLGAMHLGQSSRLADARSTAPRLGDAVLRNGFAI